MEFLSIESTHIAHCAAVHIRQGRDISRNSGLGDDHHRLALPVYLSQPWWQYYRLNDITPASKSASRLNASLFFSLVNTRPQFEPSIAQAPFKSVACVEADCVTRSTS